MKGGGKQTLPPQAHDAQRIVPHPRTLRKAREQIKYMVIDGSSTQQIRNYLHRWVMWWAITSETWQHQELLNWFLDVCWDANIAAHAASLLQRHLIKELRTAAAQPVPVVALDDGLAVQGVA